MKSLSDYRQVKAARNKREWAEQRLAEARELVERRKAELEKAEAETAEALLRGEKPALGRKHDRLRLAEKEVDGWHVAINKARTDETAAYEIARRNAAGAARRQQTILVRELHQKLAEAAEINEQLAQLFKDAQMLGRNTGIEHLSWPELRLNGNSCFNFWSDLINRRGYLNGQGRAPDKGDDYDKQFEEEQTPQPSAGHD